MDAPRGGDGYLRLLRGSARIDLTPRAHLICVRAPVSGSFAGQCISWNYGGASPASREGGELFNPNWGVKEAL